MGLMHEVNNLRKDVDTLLERTGGKCARTGAELKERIESSVIPHEVIWCTKDAMREYMDDRDCARDMEDELIESD